MVPLATCLNSDFPSQHQFSLESANIAATFFALMLLAIPTPLNSQTSAFSFINRKKILLWLKKLQRADGSFGEVVDIDGTIYGGRDMRYCYFASAIRWMLRDPNATAHDDAIFDFNVTKLVQYIYAGQTSDGGIAESQFHESHAGYAYCAVAALSLLDRPAEGSSTYNSALLAGIPDRVGFIKFCASRHFPYIEPIERDTNEDKDEDQFNFYLPAKLTELNIIENLKHVASNGRCNKIPDTCYTWWTAGALSLLSVYDVLVDSKVGKRSFLLDKGQHIIGGFAKHPGDLPDIYHGYLGLAALATLDRVCDNLPPFDEALCVSISVTNNIIEARKAKIIQEKKEELWQQTVSRVIDFSRLMLESEEKLRSERMK